MMKKLVLAMVCILANGAVVADEYSESTYSSNPVLRPITLPDTMLSLGGAVLYRETEHGSDDVDVVPFIKYGITDNFSIGVDGLTYRFYNDNGLQLAVNGGFRGASYQSHSDDSDDDDEWEVATSASIYGKQILNNQFALTFGVEYLNWDSNKDNWTDRHEWNYSAGFMYQFAPDWTFNAGYTYRDLSREFQQDDANSYSVGLTRSFGNDFEMGLFYRHNDTVYSYSNSRLDENYENVGGLYANWRF